MFGYEIRCASKITYILKNLRYKVSSKDYNFEFIPYGLNLITTPTTMQKIILR